MGFSRQENWSGLPFPSPVDHILSDLSTMTCPSWVAPGAWLSFIELDKTMVLVWLNWLVFCEYGFSVSALWCPLATYNNQLKKYITPLLRLARGALSVPLLMSMSEAFSDPFLTLIKLCYTKALEWSSLVPSPEAKSPSEIINPISFTISYQSYGFSSGHMRVGL